MSKKEVEVKYKISSYKKKCIYNYFRHHMKILAKQSNEVDIYYNSKYKDFIKSKECLRIRITNGRCVLTWKPPTDIFISKSIGYHKKEIDVRISGGAGEIRQMLESLDFVEYSVVEKDRCVFDIDDETKVVIDTLGAYGDFLEIETISEDIMMAQEKNKKIAEMLNLSPIDIEDRPYRDIVCMCDFQDTRQK